MVVTDADRRGARRAFDDAPNIEDTAFRLVDVIKVYREADVETIALRGITLSIAPGEFVAIMGRSGSGKSTLLNLLAATDRPTAGQVFFKGRDIGRLEEADRAALRGREIGIVFQSGNLVPFLSIEENVALALSIAGRRPDPMTIAGCLARVHLDDRATHRPDALSGGEQQRAAVALVLAAQPRVILADEITGELDSESAGAVLATLRDAHLANGTTIVLVTHDPTVAAKADRVLELRDGRLVGDGDRS